MLNQNRIKGNKKRKNEGSIMFLVVIVMSALIVISSTAYYAAMSSRDRVVSQYQSEQSYQTALSANETITGYIDSYVAAVKKSGNPLADNALFSAILNLAVGETLTTTQNVSGMGTAETVITMLSHIDDSYTFDISTTATVDGAVSSVNCRKNLLLADTEVVNYLNRLFTSTGMTGGKDTILSGQDVDSPLYLENETTIVQGNANKLNKDVFSYGSIIDKGWQYNTSNNINLYILKNFTVEEGGSGVCAGGGTINVGGDFNNGRHIGSPENKVNVNVLGNYYLNGFRTLYVDQFNVRGNATLQSNSSANYVKDATISVKGDLISGNMEDDVIYVGGDYTVYGYTTGSTVYVAGDLHIKEHRVQGTFYVLGDVYLDYPVTFAGLTYAGELKSGTNNSSYIHDATLTFSDDIMVRFTDSYFAGIEAELSEKTGRQDYKPWKAEEYFNDILMASGNIIKPVIYPYWEGNVTTGFVDNAEGGYRELHGKNYVTIDENCVLYPANQSFRGGIIFDATQKDLYILLKPQTGNVFEWSPADNNNIIIKGGHSVIFILPEGVSMKSHSNDFIGHLEWARVIMGTTDVNTIMYGEINGAITNNVGIISNKIRSTLIKKEDPNLTLIDIETYKDTMFNGNYDKVHNNIFIVSNSTTPIDIKFIQQSSFFGFIYAPYQSLTVGGGGRIGVFGGLVVDNYQLKNISTPFIFTSPYDYYSDVKENIVGTLIATASGGSYNPGGGGSAMPDKIIDKYSTTAYY